VTRLALLAALLALALAAPASGSSWTTFGHDVERTGFDPNETQLDGGAAARLRQTWAVPVGGMVDAQPTYAPAVTLPDGRRVDLVLVGTEAGRLLALDAASGATVWTRALGTVKTSCADLPDGVYGISAASVVDPVARRVYTASPDDRIHALDLATGAELRGWPVSLGVRAKTDHVWGALNLFRGRLYAGVSSYCNNAFYRGALMAVDVRRAKLVARRWLTGPRHHGAGIWGWGGVAIDSANGRVYAGTANGQSKPQDLPYAEHVLRFSPSLRIEAADKPKLRRKADADFGAHPLLLHGQGCPPQLVIAHKSGMLLLYDRARIARGPRQRLQLGDPESLDQFGTYAWSPPARRLFVNLVTDHDPYRAGIVALDLGTDCRLHLAWQSRTAEEHALRGVPVVADGVVWSTAGDKLYAVAADDGRRLWGGGSTFGNLVPAAPVPADGRLFAAGWDGRLHAFAPGS
jgi:outer membrane protein assembly factor BamB